MWENASMRLASAKGFCRVTRERRRETSCVKKVAWWREFLASRGIYVFIWAEGDLTCERYVAGILRV